MAKCSKNASCSYSIAECFDTAFSRKFFILNCLTAFQLWQLQILAILAILVCRMFLMAAALLCCGDCILLYKEVLAIAICWANHKRCFQRNRQPGS